MSNGVRNEPRLQDLPDEATATGEPVQDQASDYGARAPARSRRPRAVGWLLAIVVALLAIAALVALLRRSGPTTEVAPPSVPPPRTEAPAAPRYPIEQTAAALPALDDSDAAMMAALQALFTGGNDVASLLQPRDIVRNFVATVDNIPRRTIAAQRVPVKPPAGTFGAARAGEAMTIDAANAMRYRPYVSLLAGVDSTKLVQLYVRNYPLFQQAYRDLGYPSGHFNDRLVESIDVLLAAPQPKSAPRLVQPKIFYEFADRDLEQLPAGQKLMLRMGTENAATVRKKLVELRALVTASAQTAPPR